MFKQKNYYLEDLRLNLHFIKMNLILNNKKKNKLSNSQKINRQKAIKSLQDYYEIGKYPRNTQYIKSYPHIRDEFGTPCAMGYIIENNEGKKLADTFEKDNNTVYFKDVKNKKLNNWLHKYGINKQEAIQVQPSYSPPEMIGFSNFSKIVWTTFYILFLIGYSYLTYENISNKESKKEKTITILKSIGLLVLIIFLILIFLLIGSFN
jgi:hypothetical protein